MTGVFSCEPRHAEGATFRETLNMGVTHRTSREIDSIFGYLREKYRANTYNMLGNNCITFSDELTYLLVGQHLPQWLSRLPTIANTFSMFLPDSVTGGAEAMSRQKEVEQRNALIKPPLAPVAFSGTGHTTGGASSSVQQQPSAPAAAAAHQETPEEAAARREKVRQAALRRAQQQQQQQQHNTAN